MRPAALAAILALTAQAALAYDSPAVDYRRGAEALQAGRWKDAERAFTRVTQAAPNSAEAWYFLGRANAGAGDLPGAKKAYVKAAKLDPDDIGVRSQLGATLAKLKELDPARAELQALEQRSAACATTCPEAAALKDAVKAVRTAIAGASLP